jgi:hypothetical protein
MVSTTGEQFAYYELDDAEAGRKAVSRPAAQIGRADRGELRAGAVHRAVHRRRGRQLRAGVTENPVNLTRSVQG